MPAFKDFFFALTPDARADYAAKAGSSIQMLQQLAYGNKAVELGFADVLVALSDGRLTIDDIPLTERAARQHAIRLGATEATGASNA